MTARVFVWGRKAKNKEKRWTNAEKLHSDGRYLSFSVRAQVCLYFLPTSLPSSRLSACARSIQERLLGVHSETEEVVTFFVGGEGGVIRLWHQTQTIGQTNEPTNQQTAKQEPFLTRREMRLPLTYSLHPVPRPCSSTGGTWRLRADPFPMPRGPSKVCACHMYTYIFTHIHIHTYAHTPHIHKLEKAQWIHPALLSAKVQKFRK